MVLRLLKKIALNMKSLVVLLLTLALTHFAQAQESWKIRISGKTLLSASKEDPVKNKISARPSAFKAKKVLEVLFTDSNASKENDRFLGIYGPDDEELVQKMASKLTVSNKKVLAWLKKYGQLKIYTWSLPTDPDLRSRIRIRRIHLCTLELH
jgi:hypothetical protein